MEIDLDLAADESTSAFSFPVSLTLTNLDKSDSSPAVLDFFKVSWIWPTTEWSNGYEGFAMD